MFGFYSDIYRYISNLNLGFFFYKILKEIHVHEDKYNRPPDEDRLRP